MYARLSATVAGRGRPVAAAALVLLLELTGAAAGQSGPAPERAGTAASGGSATAVAAAVTPYRYRKLKGLGVSGKSATLTGKVVSVRISNTRPVEIRLSVVRNRQLKLQAWAAVVLKPGTRTITRRLSKTPTGANLNLRMTARIGRVKAREIITLRIVKPRPQAPQSLPLPPPLPPGNSAPSALALSGSAVDENRPAGTTVGTLIASDPNGDDALAFSLVAGAGSADNASFTIAGATLKTAVSFDFESKASYAIRVAVSDGHGGSLEAPMTVAITNVDESPVTSASGTLAYTENDAATAIAPALTVSDVDSPNLTGATVQISGNYRDGQDLLALPAQPAITGSFDGATGALTLSGTATVAAYQTALRTVTYRNSSDDPDSAARTVTLAARDAGGVGSAATRAITLAAVNDAPQITASAGAVAYAENDPATAIDPGLVLADPDSQITGATVQITGNHASPEDVLALALQPFIAASYDSASGTLTLSGTATVAAYQSALRAVTYLNSANGPGTATRTVSLQATDAAAAPSNVATRAITVGPVNDAPVVSTTGGATAYTENGAPVAIDGGVTASDVDDANLESLTVWISSGLEAGDVLTFTPGPLTGSYAPGTGVLTLTGSAAPATYETVLRSVRFSSTNDNPAVSKTVAFVVNDGDVDSATATKAVDVTRVNDAPVLATTSAALAYPENAGPIAADGGVTVTDPDSLQLQQATVALTSGFVSAQDELAFADQLGIAGAYDDATGVLTLSGPASVASYQAALRAVTYENVSNDPNPPARELTFSANDGSLAGTPATRAITLGASNDAATVSTTATALAYTEGDPATPLDGGLTVSDPDDLNLTGATVQITGGLQSADELLFTTASGVTNAGYVAATGTLTLSGTTTLANYQSALRAVQYRYNGDDPAGSKALALRADDGDGLGPAGTRNIAITPVNDAPTIATSAGSAAFTEGGGPVAVDGGLTLSDPDSASIQGATVSISGDFAVGDALGFTTQLGISGVYDAGTGELVLTGTATVADYRTALRSVTYNTGSDAPTSARAVSFQASDSAGSASNSATRNINLAGTNDAPVVSTTGGSTAYTEGGATVALDGGLTVTDADDANLEGARVRVSAGFDAGDDLVFSSQNGISGSLDPTTGVLTLTGTATTADYQTALRSIEFQSTNDNPALSKTISFVVNDGDADSAAATKAVAVTRVDDGPQIATTGADLAYVESDGPVAVDSGLTLTDADSAFISSASVTIQAPAFNAGQDALALAPDPQFTTTFSGGVLTVTAVGSVTVSAFQAALRTVTYTNSSANPSPATRTVAFQAFDDAPLAGNVATRGIQVTAIDDPPVAVDDSATVAEDAPATSIPVLTNDTDVDGGAKVVAAVTQPANGTVADNDSSVSYTPNPNFCNSPPGTSPDTFTYTLDGGSIATVSVTVTCAADNPVVDTSAGPLAYTESDPATPVDPGVTVTDPDAGASITGATVAITANFVAGQDVLALAGLHAPVTAGPQIGNTLTLSGTATPAAYQAALRDVTYVNTSEGPSTSARTATFTVTDDTALSGSDTRGITVAGVNDPPTGVDDIGTTDEDTPLNVAAPGVLANDTDVDPGDTKTVLALNGSGTLTGSSAEAGSVTINANGSYTYTPPAAFQALSTGESDSDSFTYTMRDAANAQSSATVNLTVNGVSDAPTAVADAFDAIGNTGLFVGTTRPASQAGKEITGSVLTNDTDPDTSPASLVAQPVTNAPTTLGGTITVASDGTFTYHPDDEDTGVTDTFTYRVCDASPCTAGTVANATGTLSLPIAGQVWYVRNNEPAGGDGTSDTPFDTLLGAETASGSGDTVFVFDGDNTTTNLDTGYQMAAGERLIGESRPLSLDPDGGGALPTVSLHPATSGAQPTLTASDEDVIGLASTVLVDGIDVDPAGTGGGISGVAGTSDVTVENVNVTDTGTAGTQPGIELDGTTGVNRFDGVTVTNGASATAIGVRINNADRVNFVASATNTIATSGARALDAAGTNMLSSQWDDVTVTGSGTGAIRLLNNTGATTLGDGAGTDLSLQTTSGVTAALDVNNATGIAVAAAGSDTISATGGPAADIRNTPGAQLEFDTVSSTNSSTDGINLDNNSTGNFVSTAGTIAGAAGIAVDINDDLYSVNYGGAINDGSGQSVEVTNRTGGGVVIGGNIADGSDAGGGIVLSANTGGTTTFSGASKVLNTGASGAVSSTTSSPSSALSFTNGGLDIDATSSTAFDAVSGGTVSVEGTANTIDSTTGRALRIQNSPIAATDVTLQRVSANGAPNGIVLDSTGTAGGLTVTGTGSAGTGGTIQNTTSDSVALTTTRDVSLTSMNVANSAESGILGSAVTNLNLASSNFTNNGDDSADVGIKVANLWGTSAWSTLSVTGSELANVLVDNTSGTLNALNVTGASHFDSLGTAFGGNSVLLEIRGTAVMTSAMIDGATFANNKPARGLTVQSQDDGRIGDASSNAFTVQNSTFTNNGLQASFEQSGAADLSFKMLNNGTPAVPLTMPDTPTGTSHAVNVASASTSTSGTIRGRIAGNRIGNAAVAGSGSAIGNAIRALIQGRTSGSLLIDGNTIRQTPQARGIDVQALGPLNASGAGPIDVTVTNNDVNPQDSTGFPASAIYVAADSQGGGSVTLRADIRGNTVPAGTAIDGLPTFLALDEVVGAAVCQLVDTPPPSANATAELTSTNTGSASAAAGCALIAGPITTPP